MRLCDVNVNTDTALSDSSLNLLSLAAAMMIPSARMHELLKMLDVSQGSKDGSHLTVRGNADWFNWASYRSC